MDDWFAVEQLEADTFAISEPRHWEEPHSYLLLGAKRALLIDTGLGVADLAAVVRSLTKLPVLAALTHAHWDHIGGLNGFAEIAVHPAEADWLAGRFPLPLAAVKQNLLRWPCGFPPGFDPARYALYSGGATRLLQDGDVLDLGGRRVTALHTPGHSPGHLCYWEAARGSLYTGDLIYAGCLDAFYPTTDPAAFRRSVARVSTLPAARLFPGHHALDVPPGLIRRVDAAFGELERTGQLRQGAGLFAFDGFQIHL